MEEEDVTEQDVDQIAYSFNRAGEDVQTFTGRDFIQPVRLDITDQLEHRGSPGGGKPAKYTPMSHGIDVSYSLPEVDRNYAEEGTIDEEGDFLYSLAVEEMTHALQAESLGIKGITSTLKERLGKRFPRFEKMPTFDAEGFASWTSDHITDFSKWDQREEELLDLYDTPVEELGEIDIDPEDTLQKRRVKKRVNKASKRTIEAYTGQAFYKAFNEDHSLEETIEEGLTPTGRDEIDEVLETIENSNIDPVLYDEVIRPYWNDETMDWNL